MVENREESGMQEMNRGRILYRFGPKAEAGLTAAEDASSTEPNVVCVAADGAVRVRHLE